MTGPHVKDEVTEAEEAPVTDSGPQTMQEDIEAFLNELSEVVNNHPRLGKPAQIGLMIQSACQLSLREGYKKKRFLQACNTYYIRVQKLMGK